jgi:tetratricopeptide (TPR) repeat protein
MRRSILLAAVLAALAAAGQASGKGENASKAARMALDMLGYEQAVALFDKAVADDPAEEGNRAGKGYALYRLGRLDDAALALRSELVRNKENWLALTLLPLVHYEKGRYDEAIEAANEFFRVKGQEALRRARAVKAPVYALRYPNAGVPAFVLGLAELRKNAPVAAENAFYRAMDLHYPEGECYLQMIAGQMSRGLWAEAGLAAATATPRTPDLAEIYVLRGIIADMLGDPESAGPFFETAQSLRPFEDWVIKNHAVHDLLAGRWELAAARLMKAALFTKDDPQAAELLKLAGKKSKPAAGPAGHPFYVDFLEKRRVEWRYIFEQRVTVVDQAANEYVLNLIRNARLNEAADWLGSFVEIHDLNPGLFYDLAKLYDIAGRPKAALRAAWSAISLKRDFRDAYDLIANIFFQARYFTLSQSFYEAAADLSPRDAWAHYNLACAYQASGDFAPAEKEWRKAIQLEEDEVRLALPGVPNQDDLEVAIRIKPDSVSYRSYFGLGGMFVMMERYDDARIAFYRAADVKPRASEPHFELGKLALRQGDIKAAEKQFQDYADRGGDKSKIPAIKR